MILEVSTGVLGSLYGSHYTGRAAKGGGGGLGVPDKLVLSPNHVPSQKNMWEATQEVLLPQFHPLFVHGQSPGSGRDFYTLTVCATLSLAVEESPTPLRYLAL